MTLIIAMCNELSCGASDDILGLGMGLPSSREVDGAPSDPTTAPGSLSGDGTPSSQKLLSRWEAGEPWAWVKTTHERCEILRLNMLHSSTINRYRLMVDSPLVDSIGM